MIKQRLISMLLVLAMLVSSAALVACSDSTDNSDSTSSSTNNEIGGVTEEVAAETEAEPVDSLAARMEVSDELPDKKFDGRTFAVIGDEGAEDYYLAEELSGEPVNDAVYERNTGISERFDVVIDAIALNENNIVGQATNTVLAGDDSYQLVACHIINLGISATSDYMYNWYDLPYVNFEQPWWSDSIDNDLRYKDKAFIAIGDFAMTALAETYCMFYNKNLATSYGMPDMYEIVNEGKWTLDKLYEFSEGVYVDNNGDGQRDAEDTYALVTDCRSNINAYLWALGKKIATQQDDGTYILDYYDDKLVAIVERLYDLYYDTGYTYFESAAAHSVGATMFPKGKSLFCNGLIGWANSHFRDAEFDYGIIPYPKWDEAQENYYTSVDGGHEGLAVLKSISDPEFVGVITEALNAESWKRLVPAYYDVSLKFKGARDEQSVAMLDQIVDSRIFDFGYVYGGWGCVFWIQYVIGDNHSKDISSYHQRNFKAFDKSMEKVYKAFDNYTTATAEP